MQHVLTKEMAWTSVNQTLLLTRACVGTVPFFDMGKSPVAWCLSYCNVRRIGSIYQTLMREGSYE